MISPEGQITDTLNDYGVGPMLRRTASALFVTYSAGDALPQQLVVWMDGNGVRRSTDTLDIIGVNYAYARGEQAMLVEQCYGCGGPLGVMLIVHACSSDGSQAAPDTLPLGTSAPGATLRNVVFDAIDGELWVALITSRPVNGQEIGELRVRLLRYTPGHAVACDDQILDPYPVNGYVFGPALACTPDGGAVLGSYRRVGALSGYMRFRRLDGNGVMLPGARNQMLSDSECIGGLEMLVHDQTVYAGYAIAVAPDTEHLGAYLMGFPLNDAGEDAKPRTARPADFKLAIQPNPFNGMTRLSFDLPSSGPTVLEVYDISGRRVQDMARGFYGTGRHDLYWNADALPSGVYLIRMRTAQISQLQKAVLIR